MFMLILMYFIIFVVIGGVIRIPLDEEKAFPAMLLITVVWFFIMGPWAVATFVELILGYSIVKKTKGE